jgi:alkylation response protein AidB-like acyl-CoA dehydrogenase|tara:strand:+ start:314 stop:1447 length:1134 start_codon:yes stop_codon:yes gene_type:complete
MRFSFTDEQHQFRDVVQRFLKDKSPATEVRRLMEEEDGFDRSVWKQLVEELGLSALHIPEKYGGQGFSFIELGIVMEEMGRSLLCAPYFSSTVLAATAILNAASEQQKMALLPKLASGECLATLAFTEPNGRWEPASIELVAIASGEGYQLDGVKSFVLDGHIADLIIVVARTPGTDGEEGLSFFTVDGNADGLDKASLQTMDPTRKQSRLDFHGVQAELLGDFNRGAPALLKTLDQAASALANEMVGGAQQMLDTAIAYSQMRVQFGRSIGSFQAIKHKCADLLLEVELARSAAYYAAAAAAEDDDDLPALASLAKSAAADTYMHAAADCIQIHGGIGFTWDHDTHLWYKRAKSSEVFLGDPSYHRELLIQRWQTD